MNGGHRPRMVAVALAVVLGLAGTVLVGYAIWQQQIAPQPPPAAAGASAPERGAPTPTTPLARSSAAPPRGGVLPASLPTSIQIPAIDVSSPVNAVGLNPDNTMEVPQPGPRYDQTAWYQHSPTPGEIGPSVIIGHVDSAENGPSVFFSLGDLEPGQRITVNRADGTMAWFAVDSVRSYPKNSFPLRTVYGDTDHAALRLITCGGTFDQATGRHLDNVVVFAHLVEADGVGPSTS